MRALASCLAVVVGAAVAVIAPACKTGECPGASDCDSGLVTPRREGGAAAAPVGRSTEVEVDYAGCETILARSADEVECVFDPEKALRVWVVHANVDLAQLEVDGRPIVASQYEREEEAGRGFRITLPEDAQRLTVAVEGTTGWSLALRAKTRLTAVQRLARKEFDVWALKVELGLLAGDEAAVGELSRLLYRAHARGLVGDAVDLGMAASFHLTWKLERADLAQQLLERLRPTAARYPEGNAALLIYLGHTWRRHGRLVEAAQAYRRGARFATRVEDLGLQIDVLPPFALLMARLGYEDAAAHWSARSLELDQPNRRMRDVAGLLEVVAFTNLQLRAAGRDYDDPTPYFDRLLELLGPGGKAKDPWLLGSVYLGLAELAGLDEDHDAVLQHVTEFRRHRSTLERQALGLDLELQARIAQGASGAELRSTFAELESVANRSVGLEGRWRAAVRKGHLLQVEGDLEGAIAAYERSEDVLDQLLPLAALGVGGNTLRRRHVEGTRRLVDALLESSPARPEAALCAARRAEARLRRLAMLGPRLSSLKAAEIQGEISGYLEAKRAYEDLLRDDDKRPGDELARAQREATRLEQRLQGAAMDILSTPDQQSRGASSCESLHPRQPGELLLGLYGLGGELTVLASGDGGVVHRALELPAGEVDLARVATQLLGPLDEALDGAERIRVLSSGPGASIPVHALPWRGEPLILQRPVVYGLDLPTAGWTGTVARGGALILSDDEAGGAPAEALAVEELLASETRAVKRFDTSHGQAVQIREQLGLNEHFYYVGHGYYSDAPEARRLRLWPPYPGGAASEPSYLPLDGVSRLEVPDILMMPTAPRSVVLMACASGVTDDRTSRGGLSLAAAFLGAGTRVVIASTRVVESADAYVLGRGLHQRLGSEAETDPGQWMAHGLRWALDHGMRAEAIAHYRVYVP